jgi:hypothetical protein
MYCFHSSDKCEKKHNWNNIKIPTLECISVPYRLLTASRIIPRGKLGFFQFEVLKHIVLAPYQHISNVIMSVDGKEIYRCMITYLSSSITIINREGGWVDHSGRRSSSSFLVFFLNARPLSIERIYAAEGEI